MFIEEVGTIFDLFTRRDFLTAVVFAVVGAAVARSARAHTRLAGAILAATFVSVVFIEPPPQVSVGPPLLVFLALATVGGLLIGDRRTTVFGGVLLLAAAGVIAFVARPSGIPTMDIGAGVTLLVGTGVVLLAAARLTPPIMLSMTIVSIAGVWATVPDTDLARVALGASVGLMVMMERTGWPAHAWGSLGAACAGIIAFTGAGSAAVRSGAAFGAWGTLAGFVAIAVAARGRRPIRPSWAIALHVGLTTISARIVGPSEGWTLALTIMVPATALATLALRYVGAEVPASHRSDR